MRTIAVIGCGNMSSPIVERMAQKNSELNFLTYTPSKTKAKALAEKVNGKQVDELEELAGADYFILAMKPQQLNDFAQKAEGLLAGKNIISILTAINLGTLCKAFNTTKVLRVMPNTPSLLGEGILLTSSTSDFEGPHFIESQLKACGDVLAVSEKQLDELTVFTGSGPAYVFKFAQLFVEEMKSKGFSEDLADRLIRQLFLGSSLLMQESELDLQTMINNVTSKGGVTIEAVDQFNQSDIDKVVSLAINKALARNYELSAELNSLK